ncbi:MAG: replication protein RepA [Bryobacterales bacterium]|nr:replication protein RepA [Bryobacterales bacterium]
MSTRTDRWRFIQPHHGEVAFLEAIDKVSHLLTDHDHQLLSHHRVEGVDSRGRIILRQSPQLSHSLDGRSKAVNLISHALASNDWATGITLKFTESPTGSSNRFKLLYLPPAFVNMTLPHSKLTHNEFTRFNGDLSLSILSRKSIGLPYGSIARLILLYLTTVRVTSKERRFRFTDSWRDFLKTMGINWGSRTRRAAQNQLERLCSSSFSVLSKVKNDADFKGMFITDHWQRTAKGIRISLSEKFFILSGKSVVPLETKIIHHLRHSPLAIDLYSWLTYRTTNVNHPTLVKWKSLEQQFGSNYKRTRDFRSKFCSTIENVLNHKPVTPVLDLLPEGLHMKPASAADMEWVERMRHVAFKRSL